jgi:FixJ family two-component response regulator
VSIQSRLAGSAERYAEVARSSPPMGLSPLMANDSEPGYTVPNPPRVAIVEDDLPLRRSLARLLRSGGCTVFDYESAESFLVAVESVHPDCVVLDIQLGGMSGPEAKTALDRRGLSMPVAFMTAFSEEETRKALARYRGVPCLRKPFEAQALLMWAHSSVVLGGNRK